jgi:hypothetical protein
MMRFLLCLSCAAMLFCMSPLGAQPQHGQGGGKPAGGHQAAGPGGAARAPVHYQHPAAPQTTQVRYHPVPTRPAPDQFHPAATHPVQVFRPQVTRNVTIRNPQVYRDINNYHVNEYHTTFNVTYAAHPGSDRGYWGNGWYHGYWHDYWAQQNWTSWGGHYGFWLALDGLNVFVYEYSPGVCWYWDGSEWAPWYNPPYTPYDCPY